MTGLPNLEEGQAPIFVTVKDAAAIIGGTSPWTIYRLCKTGAIESRLRNNRRLVVRASLLNYAANLPAGVEDAS